MTDTNAITTTTTQPIIRRKFQFVSLQANSNKFWMVEYWADGTARTTYGRTEKTRQVSNFTGWDERKVNTEIRNKLRKGYTELDLPRAMSLVSQASLDERTARFIHWISAAAGASIKASSGSIEGLSATQIARGRALLLDVQHARMKRDAAREVASIEAYLNAVPTQLPAKIVIADIVRGFDLSGEENRLNQLETALATAHAHSDAEVYTVLGAELKPMRPDSRPYQQIRDLVNRTAGSARIEDIFSVRIPAERARFEACTTGKAHVTSLFHGTRVENVRHILRDGLKLPGVVGNGKRYGWGMYFADRAFKSISYAHNAASSLRCLLVCDVAVGNVCSVDGEHRRLVSNAGSLRAAPPGYHSVLGNEHDMPEYIVFDPAQVTIRAVVTIEGKGVRY